MTRARIVLETSDKRKSELIAAASLQGASLADWFEEHVTTTFPHISRAVSDQQHQANDIENLEDPNCIFETLSARDWAFTEDDTRYLTHDLHPYPAKFIPQIPAHLISCLSVQGDVVLDPFGGSATTAVEAVRLGRRAISFDANPLSALIGRVKTGFMAEVVRADLEQLCAAVEGHIMCFSTKGPAWPIFLGSRHRKYLPEIPNLEKWFEDHVTEELCIIRNLIELTTSGLARDAAHLALSRVIIRVSNQDSETRYVSVDKNLQPTITLQAYLESLKSISRRLETAAIDLQFADANFLVGDSRYDLPKHIGENAVDLIVTSPPYPNATDYHLYHRFRLFWLGFDPKALGKIEIGSHLRHQRNETGFEEYRDDMSQALAGCAEVLMPGRYAVFVVGDAIFKGENFSTSDAIASTAREVGFEVLGVIDRPVHKTKRSFAKPGRRLRSEQLVVLRKPNRAVTVHLHPPAYRMWKYEEELRVREINALTCKTIDAAAAENPVKVQIAQPATWHIRRLTFTREYTVGSIKGKAQPTWQKVLENGDSDPTRRKDPKYVTHGLHPFKGKFYPQLVKSLLNISDAPIGSRLLDPYCGSGTTLLEGMLNGYSAHGCDFNPLAAKIAHAKTSILTVPRDVVDLSIRAILDRMSHLGEPLAESLEQFPEHTHDELFKWFPDPVLHKLNWLLTQARLFGTQSLVDYFEVIISSLIREVSHQDPTDLRIRRRKEPLADAPVLQLFRTRLEDQHVRLQKYWSIAGRQPGPLTSPTVIQGDSRTQETFRKLHLEPESVDCIVTSPPYATALPYIDTDRLSLLAILGIPASDRTDLEENLTGSREIRRRFKITAETELLSESAADTLPAEVVHSIRKIRQANQSVKVGFRRANMPALLWRYFSDMKQNLSQVIHVMKPGARAFYVVGDSRTKAGGKWVAIESCKNLTAIAEMVGLRHVDSIDIDVTTETYKHMKNAITKNRIIVFEKS